MEEDNQATIRACRVTKRERGGDQDVQVPRLVIQVKTTNRSIRRFRTFIVASELVQEGEVRRRRPVLPRQRLLERLRHSENRGVKSQPSEETPSTGGRARSSAAQREIAVRKRAK